MLIFLTRTWKNGMMEYWNTDLKKMISIYLILVKGNFTTTQFSISPKPNVPVFQYSNIPIVSKAN
jgi:hypothetical protein